MRFKSGKVTGFGLLEVWTWRDFRTGQFKRAVVEVCPKCGEQFDPFMRGRVVRSELWQWIAESFGKRAKTALICWDCKEIIGWE